MPEAQRSDNQEQQRYGIGSVQFLGFLATQFLGAVNDNMFRWLAVPIAKYHVEQGTTGTGAWNKDDLEVLTLSAGLACFVLPYVVLRSLRRLAGRSL